VVGIQFLDRALCSIAGGTARFFQSVQVRTLNPSAKEAEVKGNDYDRHIGPPKHNVMP